MSNKSRLLQKLRVPIGFVCAALFFLLSRPTWLWLAAGAPLILAGLATRGWAAGHIRKGQALATSGPYARTRNPLYFGSFLMGLGFALQSSWWPLVLVFGILFILIYWPVMRQEEREIADAYGSPFEEYRRRVPLFLPACSARMNSTGQRFSAAQYRRNREYQATIGVILVEVILILKILCPVLMI
ncbi:MAG TPA: isoprenylcysteine carboxylmethyltransferase family protein [Acidobacteriota bacterium]|nr:isoprenylcysteine carboxylmethyltransferase family protein [Acidobacteriota bacterium]